MADQKIDYEAGLKEFGGVLAPDYEAGLKEFGGTIAGLAPSRPLATSNGFDRVSGLSPRPMQPAPISPLASSVDPFAPEQKWLRGNNPPPPSFQSPVKGPSPVVQDRPGPEAVRPIAPTSIPPTVETTPVGRANAPVPGRIPGMERLGGAAPGVPPVAAQINETNAPSLAGDVGGGFVRGVASGAMAVPRALSRVPGGFRDDINALRRTREDIEPNRFGLRTPEQVAEDDARLRQISNSDINRFEQAALPAAPVTGAGKFAEALGSTAPYMAAGVAGPAGPAALGILAGTEESLGRSDASGIPLSDAKRLGVGAAGAAIGSTEALPFGRLLGRLKGAGVIADAVDETQLVKQLFPGLKDYAVSAGKQAIEEGVQEGTSNVLQDVTEASYGGRPVNRIGEGLGESVTTGGGVGALVDVLTTLAGSRAGRARLSQNGVDPVALMAWVQANEVSPSMTAEFDTLARENRAPNPPQAVPQAAPTPIPAESPAPAPPQQAEVPAQVPPPQPSIEQGIPEDERQAAVDNRARELGGRRDRLAQERYGKAFNDLQIFEKIDVDDSLFGALSVTKAPPPPPPAGFTVDPLPGAVESAPDAESVPSSEASEMPAPVKQDGPAWAMDVQPTENINGVWTEHPSTRAIIASAEQELIDRGRITREDIPALRRQAGGKLENGAQHGEAYARVLQAYLQGAMPKLDQPAPTPAPGPRKEVVQPVPVDAAAPVAEVKSEQEPDATLSPEVAAPPSAVEDAAPEAQPPAAPKEPPAGVAASVKRYLETISDVNRQLAEARTVDDKFGGEGRYENEVWDRLMGEDGAVTAEANKKLQVFRELAVKNGVDAEAFIEKMGGMPESPALSERAKKYRGESVPPALESPGERSEAEAAVDRIVGDRVGSVTAVDDMIDAYFSDPRKAVLDEIKKRLTDLQYDQVAFDELNNEQRVAINFIMANKVTDDADLPTVKIRRAGDPFSTPTVKIEDRGDAYMDRKFAIKNRIRKGEVPTNKDMAFLSDTDRAYMVKFGEAEGVVIPPRAAKGKKSAPVVEEPVAPPAPPTAEKPKDFQWNGPVPNFENFRGRQPNPAPDAPPPADSRIVYGKKSGTAKLSRGYSVPFTWGVVPAESLVLSNEDNGDVNKRFPQDLQPRQRDRAASEMQIQGIADKLDPEQVAESYVAGDGAPFIFDDMAVESGNGRGLAIRRAYRRKMAQAEAYRNWLADNAERFGLSRSAVMAIENPVLVRVRTGLPEGISRQDFTRDANEDTKAQMAEGEQAMVDAKSMSDELVSMFMPNETGEIATRANFPFILQFIQQVVPEGQRGAMQLPDKSISKKGIDRIRNAVFARAYNDRGIVERLAEDPDDNIKSVVGGLTIVAPKIIWMRSGIEAGDFHDLDISQEIAAAAGKLSYLRENRTTINDYLNQMTLEPRDPVEDALLEVFGNYGRSSANIAEVLGEYVDAVQALGNPKQESMFGEAPVPTKLELLGAIVEEKRARDEAAKREKQQRKAGREADQAGGLDAEGEPGGATAGEGSPGPRPRAKEQGDSEVVGYAPKGTLGAKPPSNGSRGEAVNAGPPSPPTPGQKLNPTQRSGNAPKTTAMVSRGQIVSDLSRLLGDIPIRTGGFSGNADGIFKIRQVVIRTKRPLDLRTIAHEIGHAVHKSLWGARPSKTKSGVLTGGWRLDSRPLRKFQDELGPLDYDKNQQRAFEGFAEYMRLRLTEPGVAQQKAPKFHAWFNRKLATQPELEKVLLDTERRIGDWFSQPAAVKMAASMQTEAAKANRWAGIIDRIIVENFDNLRLVEKIQNEMVEAGAPLRGDGIGAYELMRMLPGSNQKAASMIYDGTYIDNGIPAPLGMSFKDIVKPLVEREGSGYNKKWAALKEKFGVAVKDDSLDDLRVYVSAKRFQNYHENELETGWTPEELQEIIDSTETPEVKKAAQQLSDFSFRVLDYAVDKGLMTKSDRDAIESKNSFYAPIWRLMDTNASSQRGGGNSGARKILNLPDAVRARKGSTREWTDPLENYIHNTFALVSLADRFEAGAELAKQAYSAQGMGKVLESGIAPKMVKTTFNLKEVEPLIKRVMEENGFDTSDVDIDAVAALYRPSMRPDKSKGEVLLPEVVTDQKTGKPVTTGRMAIWHVDRDLANSLQSQNEMWNYTAYRAAATVADALRLGATGIGPEFVVRNPVKDTFEAGMNSDNGFIPVVDTVLGAVEMYYKNPDILKEIARGGGGGGYYNTPTKGENESPTFLDKVALSPPRYVLRHPREAFSVALDLLQSFGQQTEAATRVGEYRLAKRAGKPYKRSVMAYKDVTLDFSMQGLMGRIINPISAYYSATMNSNYRAAKNMANPKTRWRTIRRGVMYFTLPTIALWLLNKDDPEYEELPHFQKTFFWNIPTKYMPQNVQDVFGPFMTIPRAHIYGLIFGALPEMALNRAYKKNPEPFSKAATAFIKDSMGVVIPGFIPNVILTPLEIQTNHSFFRGQKIVPDTMKNTPAEFQSQPNTTWTAKKIAKGLNSMGVKASPLLVEHAIYGLSASAGRFIITGAEKLAGARINQPAPEGADMPIIRAFSSPSVPRSPESVSRVYDRLSELNGIKQAAAEAKKHPNGSAAGAREMTEQEKLEYRKLDRVAHGKGNAESLASYNNQIKDIIYDETVSPADKTKQINYLKKLKVNVARKALGLEPAYRNITKPLPTTPTPGAIK